MPDLYAFFLKHWLNLLPLLGLVFVLIGAALVVRSVYTTKEKAGQDGVPYYADENPDEWHKTRAARGLLRASKGALWGFVFVFIGTGLQAVPLIVAIWFAK